MAEVVGLVTSIVQIANNGLRLNTTLYDLAGGARRADQQLTDIADRVNTTAISLKDIANVIQQDEGACDVSKNAMSEAGGLAKQCEAVFAEVQHLVDKRRELGKEGMSRLERFKEQRLELLMRRLEGVKLSVLLLLHVLVLANEQAKGNIEDIVLARERDTIRELHQCQQKSLQALQALENKLGDPSPSDDAILNGSAPPSRVPTINFLVNSSALGAAFGSRAWGIDTSSSQAPGALADDFETSDSGDTVADDDGDLLTYDELAQCANQVQHLLDYITTLQRSYETRYARSDHGVPRKRVMKLYRRFCRRFESATVVRENAIPAPDTRKDPAVQTHASGQDWRSQGQHPSIILPDPSGLVTDRVSNNLYPSQDPQNRISAPRPTTEGHYAATTPAWTISSEPLGQGNRPKLPPLVSAVPRPSQASPVNESLSPGEDQYARHNSTDGDAEHGSQEAGPVVYTKTGRISKAKKGLKVHVCEECGRSFTRAEHLRRHQKNHGPNQVRCELCGKVFFRADLLQRHLERHKDLPQSYRSQLAQAYRFGDAPAPTTEGTSPMAADEPHHRHILPAPNASASAVPPQHSPTGRSVDSSGASGAPTPLEHLAASPAVAQRPHSSGETSNGHSGVPRPPEGKETQRQHAWQPINMQERKQAPSEPAQVRTSQQQPHPGRPRLLPKVNSANGASAQKRYSNILPAPGAPNAQHHNTAYPQGHMPNMLPREYGTSPTQVVPKEMASPASYYDFYHISRGPRDSPRTSGEQQDHDRRVVPPSPTATSNALGTGAAVPSIQHHHQSATQSPIVPALGHSPRNAVYSFSKQTLGEDSLEGSSGGKLLQHSHHSSAEAESGKLSSDKEGVNWRMAETDARQHRKTKSKWTANNRDADSSEDEVMGDGHATHRITGGTKVSYPGSRSLSLVMPQDERDHALLGKLPFKDRRSSELSSPYGERRMKALSPKLAEQERTTHLSTASSDPCLQAGPEASANSVDRSKSPERTASEGPLNPESPYSLATINRYIQNQGPQPGVDQGEGLAAPSDVPPQGHAIVGEEPLFQGSRPTAACERCREYSIKCDGRLPTCTACATTKYAGECSFASLPLPTRIPVDISQAPLGPKSYENISAITRHAMAEPHGKALQPHAAGTVQPDQEYNADDDLPSPYLKPRDKAQHPQTTARVSGAPLDIGSSYLPAQTHDPKKRKSGDGQHDDVSPDAKAHERKRSKGNHAEESTRRQGSGKERDGADMLLHERTVPVP